MNDSAIPQVEYPRGASIKTADAVAALVAAKRAANYRPRYVRSLHYYLGQFARGREDVPLSEVTVETVERWFSERAEAPSTQRANFGRLCSLFSFSERRGWITKSPMKLMERIRVDPRPPKILTVDQAERLMDFATQEHPRSLAFLSLALFGGVRPEELQKVTWDHVRGNLLTVDAAASKVRRRRIVHLRDNAEEWINFAREVGAVLPFRLDSRVRMLRKAARHLGFEDGWPQDILRHTAASFWLGDTRDAGSVARELGNSPAILLTHYYEIVTAEQASAFWRVRPNWLAALEHRWNGGKDGEMAARDYRARSSKGAQGALLDFIVNHQPQTQAALAKQLGISEAQVSRLVRFTRAKMGTTQDKLVAIPHLHTDEPTKHLVTDGGAI